MPAAADHLDGRLKGSIPPLITPFKNGEVDYDAYARLVALQMEKGQSRDCGQWNHLGTSDADSGRTQQARRCGARRYREARAGSGGDRIAIAGGNQTIDRACG